MNRHLTHLAALSKSSKLLKKWVAQGLPVPDPTRAKLNMVYNKADVEGVSSQDLLSFGLDNNTELGHNALNYIDIIERLLSRWAFLG